MNQLATKGQKTGVQTLYTEASLSAHLFAQKAAGRSLREIAKDYGPLITHADIQRGIQGEFPKRRDKREAMGLPLRGIEVNVIFLFILIRFYHPPKPRIYHRLDTMPVWMLRWMIENREDV